MPITGQQYAPIRLTGTIMKDWFGAQDENSLIRGYRHDRRRPLDAGIGDREQQHDDPERVLGLDVSVRDPKPPLILLHGNIRFLGPRVGNRHSHRRSARRLLLLSLDQSGGRFSLVHICLGYLHNGREFEHDLQHRTRYHVDLIVFSRVAAIVYSEFP